MEVVTSDGPHSTSKEGIARQSGDYEPSIWGDYFIAHPSLPSSEVETWMRQRVSELIEEVKVMLRDAEDPISDMHLIDALQRLGVDYHFEKEISEALLRIHNVPTDGDDLHRTALQFRLLREASYDVPSDVFTKFKDDQGNFKGVLRSNLKGLLSLYEAAFLAKPGEDVLDEALTFARSHLESMASHLEPPLAKQVLHALETPLYRRMRRLEARFYISIYEQDVEVRNDAALELAKLDFHLLQLLHREEIRAISIWWKELGLSTKLTFAKDRVPELYFWILGVYFEPRYSRARMMMTKVIIFLSPMDDIYDVYGTLDELRQYTDVIERWNLEDADKLEGCMKIHFLALSSTIKDFENELASEGLSYRVNYLRDAIKVAARAFLEEAKWREEGCVPSLEDHLRVSQVSTCYDLLSCASFLGMGEVATKEAFDWVISFPKIIEATTTICRLMDDVVSNELESKRKHVASTIQCYIKEHGASTEEACEKLLDMVEDSWKEINQELINLKEIIPMPLLTQILNLSRMMETIYRNNDRYTHSGALKDYIQLLLVQPIPL